MTKPTKPRDPHLVHVVCLNKKCKAVYDLAPVTWTADGGYYSSDRDFCKECGGDQIDVSYPWLVKRVKLLLTQMKTRIERMPAKDMRAFILALYDVLWNPPDKEWSSETFNEIVSIFQLHDLVPSIAE